MLQRDILESLIGETSNSGQIKNIQKSEKSSNKEHKILQKTQLSTYCTLTTENTMQTTVYKDDEQHNIKQTKRKRSRIIVTSDSDST